MQRRFVPLVPLIAGLVCAIGLGSAAGFARGDDNIVFERNLEYSNPDSQHLKLDLARPKNPTGLAPAVLCIHGGGWTAGDKESWDGICQRLAENGYVAATVGYRFAPKYAFPAQLTDVKAAVRWLRANAERLKIDPKRIGVIGDSAGGHLSMLLGTTGDEHQFDGNASGGIGAGGSSSNQGGNNLAFSSRVQCVVDFYGPADLTRGYGMLPAVDKMISNFMGGDLEHARRQHVLASPLYWATPDAAPMLLVQGTKDTLVNYQQAVWMRDRLKSVDVEVELMTIENGGHGFQGDDLKRAYAASFEFFDRHLKGEKK